MVKLNNNEINDALDADNGYVDEEEYDEEEYDEEGERYVSEKILPDVEVHAEPVITNGRQDGYNITFLDMNKNARYSQYDYEKDILASLRSDGNNVKSFYSYNDGVLTVNDYDRGVVKTIDCSRDENGNFSIQEKPMYIDERKKGYEQLGWDFEETKYGTFFRNISEYAGGTFMKTDGTKDTAFSGGGLYNQNYVGKVTLNGLAKTTATTYTAQTIDGSNGWGLEDHSIYDFKNSQYREDLEDLIDLGRKFYAVKKIGEKQFGIYEMADETMKNPLIMVDSCHLTNTNNYSGNTKNESNNIVFAIGGKEYVVKETENIVLFAAKNRVRQNLEQNKAMTADIKEGMAKTKESGYKHISRTPSLNKGGREE